MNPLTNMKNVLKLSEQELHLNLKTSWHDQYKNSAWIFIGGLPYDLTEGDVICIFSQYGEVVNINLVRDKASGKQKGFCFLCYEDQRSTILAVDNFNGTKILGRTIRVDHCEDYKAPKESKNMTAETALLHEEGCATNPFKIKQEPSSPSSMNHDRDSESFIKKEFKKEKVESVKRDRSRDKCGMEKRKKYHDRISRLPYSHVSVSSQVNNERVSPSFKSSTQHINSKTQEERNPKKIKRRTVFQDVGGSQGHNNNYDANMDYSRVGDDVGGGQDREDMSMSHPGNSQQGSQVIPDEAGNLRILVRKTKPLLGIAIEGGANTRHPLPRIININENGAAYEAGGLQVGQLILEVDGHKVEGMHHQEVARLIAESFAQRDKPHIEFLVVEAKKSNLEPKPTALIFLEA